MGPGASSVVGEIVGIGFRLYAAILGLFHRIRIAVLFRIGNRLVRRVELQAHLLAGIG